MVDHLWVRLDLLEPLRLFDIKTYQSFNNLKAMWISDVSLICRSLPIWASLMNYSLTSTHLFVSSKFQTRRNNLCFIGSFKLVDNYQRITLSLWELPLKIKRRRVIPCLDVEEREVKTVGILLQFSLQMSFSIGSRSTMISRSVLETRTNRIDWPRVSNPWDILRHSPITSPSQPHPRVSTTRKSLHLKSPPIHRPLLLH